MPKPTQITDKWFSLYIRLRDAMEFHEETGADISLGRCCTCGKIAEWKYMDCGHFLSKGIGGASGVRWDERNAHLQCKRENAFLQGNYPAYEQFMLEKYGQAVIDELRLKHRLPRPNSIDEYGIYYREAYKELKKELGLTK